MAEETFGILTDKSLSIYENKESLSVPVSSFPLSSEYEIKDIFFDKKNKKFIILTKNAQVLRSGIYDSMFSLDSKSFEILIEMGCISVTLSDKNTLLIMDNQGLWELDDSSGNWDFIYKVMYLKNKTRDL